MTYLLSEPPDTKMEKRPLHSYGTSGACCIEILVDETFYHRKPAFGCSVVHDLRETVGHNSFILNSQAKGGVLTLGFDGCEDRSMYDATHIYGCGGLREFMDKHWDNLSIAEYEDEEDDEEL